MADIATAIATLDFSAIITAASTVGLVVVGAAVAWGLFRRFLR